MPAMLGRLRWLLIPLLVLFLGGTADAASAYVSPFTTTDYYVGRTDMGVDICLSHGDPIAAVGDGVIVGIEHNWFRHEPFLWYQLSSGPDAGRSVYVAEQISHLAHVGQTVTAGQTVAVYAKKGTCIETGWAAADGQTLAQAAGGYREGEVTGAGISFARFLIAQGLEGSFELTPPAAQIAPGTGTATTGTTTTGIGASRRFRTGEALGVPAGSALGGPSIPPARSRSTPALRAPPPATAPPSKPARVRASPWRARRAARLR